MERISSKKCHPVKVLKKSIDHLCHDPKHHQRRRIVTVFKGTSHPMEMRLNNRFYRKFISAKWEAPPEIILSGNWTQIIYKTCQSRLSARPGRV